MRAIETSRGVHQSRRHFIRNAAIVTAAAQFGMMRAADAQIGEARPAHPPAANPGANTSFGLLKQIDAGVLNVGYAEAGPADGRPVLLLHGWPYDIHSYVDVVPILASAGTG
jgi:hypothetical protein